VRVTGRTAVAVTLVLLAGCGSVQDGAVAIVDGEPISASTHAHWSRALAAARGQPPASAAIRAQALDLLITGAWLEREARTRGLEVSDAELGTMAADPNLRVRERIRLLADRLRAAMGIAVEPVSAGAVARYYRSHRNRFRGPARRGIRSAVTASADRAGRARSALGDGASWRAVVRRFALDTTPAVEDGRLTGISDRQDRAIGEAVFRAGDGEVIGPVATTAGHYLLLVDRVGEPRRRPLADVAPEIRQLLASEAQERAHERLLAALRSKWLGMTECARELATRNCGQAS
jgi:hypothetical protein